jgi:hypothetical protein
MSIYTSQCICWKLCCHRWSEGHCRRDRSLRTGDVTSIRNHCARGKVGTESRASLYNKGNSRRRSAAARLLGLRVRIPPAAWLAVCCECCMLQGRGLCDGPKTRPEESYRLWCRSVSVISCNNNPLHLQWVGRVGQTKKERKKKENASKRYFVLLHRCEGILMFSAVEFEVVMCSPRDDPE